MRKSVQRMSVIAGGACAVVLAVASVAWACTGNPWIEGPNTCTPGQKAEVHGEWFTGPVELHWDRAGGPLLGRFVDGFTAFRGSVKVPATAAPGVHAIVAVQQHPETGEVEYTRSAACQVLVADRAGDAQAVGTPAQSATASEAPGLLDPAPNAGLGLRPALGMAAAGVGVLVMSAAAVGEVRRRVPATVRARRRSS